MRRISFHLSTYLFGMLVTAALLWVNFTYGMHFDPRNPGQGFPVYRYVGWPCPAIAVPSPNHPDFNNVLIIPLAIDICVVVAIVLISAILFDRITKSALEASDEVSRKY